MGVQPSDQAARHGRPRKGRALRLGLLFGVLAGVTVFALVHGSSSAPRRLSACDGEKGAPEVRAVTPEELSSLRADVARVAPQRLARLYEEGPVHARSAWTDEEPAPPAVSPAAPRPDAYEMRWWAPNGDDLVADELVFANASAARRFVTMAASPHCRLQAARTAAVSPQHGLDLRWLNPDGVAQADLLLEKGASVFRVADVPAAQHRGQISPASLAHAFALVNALACLLPSAHCVREHKGATLA